MASLLHRYARLPRATQRILLFLGVSLSLFLLFNLHKSQTTGVWDASSSTDRRADSSSIRSSSGLGVGQWLKKTLFRPSKPSWLEEAGGDLPPAYLTHHGPNLSRLNKPPPRRTHRGVSRTLIPNSYPEQFETAPLPTLEEAFARLHPMLQKIKDETPAVPREHELGSPLFPPYLTKDQQNRFQHLRAIWDEDKAEWVEVERRWMLVTVCRQVAGMLADWFAMWTVLADYLGPESLSFSLLEGGSDDGSGEILAGAMRDHLLHIGVPPANIHIRTLLPQIDWEGHHRIELLADMRNAGMKPFYDSIPAGTAPDGIAWTGVLFHNDVYLGATHILELMHQHMSQEADMTCGWDHAGRWFYDGWVGRDMSGDLYTPFPVKEEDKDAPQKLFLSSPPTRERHNRLLPYQVFAGWNGIALMRPDPFYPPYNVRFRRGKPTGLPENYQTNEILKDEYECQQSESSFISWDFWKYGFGRIGVVPGVHACYGKDDARMRGYVEWPEVDVKAGYRERIDWDDEPPRRVRCHDWPDKPGKGYWAWDTVRWVEPPALVIPEGAQGQPHPPEESQEAVPGPKKVKANEKEEDVEEAPKPKHKVEKEPKPDSVKQVEEMLGLVDRD